MLFWLRRAELTVHVAAQLAGDSLPREGHQQTHALQRTR